MPSRLVAVQSVRLSADELAAIEAAERSFAGLEMVPFVSPATIADALRSTSVIGEHLLQSGELDRLLGEAAGFLYARFGQGDIEVYKARMRGLGYGLKDHAEIGSMRIGEVYRAYFAADPEPGMSDEALFDACWTGSTRFGDGYNLPLRLAASRAGLAVVIADADGADPVWPATEGELPAEVWRVNGLVAGRFWWRLLDDRAREVDPGDRLAVVACVFEYADGPRRPIRLYFRLRRSDPVCVLDHIGFTNHDVDRERMTAMEF